MTPPLGISEALDELEGRGVRVLDTLERVEARLREQVETSHAFVEQAARYLMDAGGKRFRPLLVALTAHLGREDAAGRGGPYDPRIADAGVVVELVHLATLYHDDVIDEAIARRGAPSANARWDNTVAILTGDYLFARASELSADLGVEVTRIMAQTIATLCEGQVREVQGSRGALPPDVPALEPTLEHYLRVVGDKTAILIATSCRLGALLSGCTTDEVEALASYGWNIGMAFQLSDDILDIASEHEQSGKTPGTDLMEGVRTLPVLYALRDDADGELSDLLDTDELTEDQLARALELLRSSGALAQARATAQEYADRAVADIARFGDNDVTKALSHLARFSVDRVG